MRINYLHIAFLSLMSLQNLTAQTYCASKGNFPWNEWIAQVQFAGINHTSVKEGYGNFVTKTAIVNRGSTYPMTVTKGFSWASDPSNATQQGRVWMDFNQNGTFETTELVASFHRNATTANITIPTTATLGNTRMRIALKTIGIPTPCEIFDKGEVEDYTINIGGGTTSNLPDLTLANLNLTNPSVLQGQVLNYKFDLKNIGIGDASGSFNVKGYISRDNILSSDDIQDGIVPTGNFNAGFSVPQVPAASTIPATLAAGQYYLILKVDADNQVVEHNENNNIIISVPFQVTGQTSSLPDLTIELLDSEPFSYPYFFNEPFARATQVRARIQTTKFIPDDRTPNITYTKTIRFYLSTDALLSADDRLIADWGISFDSLITQLSFLKVFEGIPNPVSQTFASGKFYIIAVVNALDQIAESNVSNNVSNALPVELYQSKCVSKSDAPWNLWVSNVNFNTIHNPSGQFRLGVQGFYTKGNTNWVDKTTTVSRNAIYPLSVTNATAWVANPAPIFTRVWIDFNADGDYDDAGEKVLESNAPSSQNISTNVSIPANARIGFTTMRVSSKFANYAGTCDTFDVGEVEDYGIYITNTAGLARTNATINNSNTISYDVNIFPNPATNEVFLDLKDFENQPIEILISDIGGRAIFKQTIEKGSISPHRLNTSTLKNGTYFIEIQSVEKSITRKLYILN